MTLIHPGAVSTSDDESVRVGESRNVTAVDTLLDLARNLFPPNLVQVCIKNIKKPLQAFNDKWKVVLAWTLNPENLIPFCMKINILKENVDVL